MSSLDFSQLLNEDQYAAVAHDGGHQLVLAGAGSGKTRVIIHRIAWLIEEWGAEPQEISAVTFTNKAAGEMRERLEHLLGGGPISTFVGTFHRFALRLLRMYGDRVGLPRDFLIFDTSDQQALIKRAMKALKINDKNFQPMSVLSAISSAKNQLLTPLEYEKQSGDYFSKQVAPLYRQYQKMMREAGGVDFDDMIFLAVRLLSGDDDVARRVRRRTKFLLVDEFQDTNHAQLALVHALVADGGRLTAVGDEDQSIYRWRGAEIDNILTFEKHFPGAEVRKLERNYRSTQNVLDAADALVKFNEKRRGKTLWTDVGDGPRPRLYRARDEQDEARWAVRTLDRLNDEYSLSDMAILVRTKAQTRAFEEELMRRKIEYSLIGSVRFYERAEIKDLVAYLRLARNPREIVSFNRVLNRPARGIGKGTHQMLLDRAEEKGKTPWDVLKDGEFDDFPARGRKALLRFHDLIDNLCRLSDDLTLPALLKQILDATEFRSLFDEEDKDGRSRLENINELVNAAQEFTETPRNAEDEGDRLTAFLDHASLSSSADVLSGQKLSLMTLHSAKGLEFGAVVVAGLEEDLLPHFNAKLNPDELEEERRLLYVGMTRAKERLILTTCARRRVAGQYQNQQESRFLAEVGEHRYDAEQSPELFSRPAPRQPSWSTGRRRPASNNDDNIYSFFKQERPASSAPEPEDEPQVAPDEPARQTTLFEAPARPAAPKPPAPKRAAASSAPKSSSKQLRRGVRVRHPSLGRGHILDVQGTGDTMRLKVYFEGIGPRKLVAKYAQLEIL